MVRWHQVFGIVYSYVLVVGIVYSYVRIVGAQCMRIIGVGNLYERDRLCACRLVCLNLLKGESTHKRNSSKPAYLIETFSVQLV